MIPKKIHYCWFGGKEKPEDVKRYIASWEKYCPDYEIKEWNESNFDIHENDYCSEAYEAKKWAFVTDYVRLKALYEEGGLLHGHRCGSGKIAGSASRLRRTVWIMNGSPYCSPTTMTDIS